MLFSHLLPGPVLQTHLSLCGSWVMGVVSTHICTSGPPDSYRVLAICHQVMGGVQAGAGAAGGGGGHR